MRVQRVLRRVVRRITRHVSLKVMSPMTLAVSVTSFFLVAFIPMLVYHRKSYEPRETMHVADQVK
jgi:hypothetical protein